MLSLSILNDKCEAGVIGIDRKFAAPTKFRWVTDKKRESVLAYCLHAENAIAQIDNVIFVASSHLEALIVHYRCIACTLTLVS